MGLLRRRLSRPYAFKLLSKHLLSPTLRLKLCTELPVRYRSHPRVDAFIFYHLPRLHG